MDLVFVEVTDGMAYGKFTVGRFDSVELSTPSSMPEARGARLLTHAGRRRFNDHSTMICDLQRGVGAAWPLDGGRIGMEHYLREHLRELPKLVCPLYLTFVAWLHDREDLAMGRGHIDELPAYLDLRELP